jgi:hypothetical protein
LSPVGFFGREQGNIAAPLELGVAVKRNFQTLPRQACGRASLPVGAACV